MHQANGCGALIDSGRISRIIILTLAPRATLGHLAVDTFPCGLCAAIKCKERPQAVLIDAIVDIANYPCLLVAQRILRETSAWVKVSLCIHGKHPTSPTPVLVLQMTVHRLTQTFLKEGTYIIAIQATINNGICKLCQLLFEEYVVARLPHILKHAVNVYLVYAKRI